MGGLRGCTPWGWSAPASMASHAASGIPSPAGWTGQFPTGTLLGRWTRALEGGLCPGPLSQLPELCVGPALPPLSLNGAVALGGGVGVGGCCGVVGTGCGGGPGGVLVVLSRGSAWGAGARADVDPRGRAHRLRLRVGMQFAVAALAGHLLDLGWHRGQVGGLGRCW